MTETKLRGRQLLAKGEAEVFEGRQLRHIGMPVGGLFAGTVYLGGDGQLWNWDIFNQVRLGCVDRPATVFMGDTLNAMSGANYVDPVRQQSPFAQRFFFVLEGDKPRPIRFGKTTFRGEYPVGRVEYTQADGDIEASLVAFSPFCPLDAESSSHPATTLTFRVKNTGNKAARVSLCYESENPVLNASRKTRSDFLLDSRPTEAGIVFFAKAVEKSPTLRAPIMFEDWSSGGYGAWKKTGTAFGDGPQEAAKLPGYMGPVNSGTRYVVNTHQTRNGEDVVQGDDHQGTLESPAFTISRRFINLRIGGGSHKGRTCVNLVVNGEVARSATGRDSNAMQWTAFETSGLEGQQAHLVVVDEVSGPWGQISLGEVEFADEARTSVPLDLLPDYGEFCMEFLGGPTSAEHQPGKALIKKTLELPPGGEAEATLVIAWRFPNCPGNVPGKRHWHAQRWPTAEAVAKELRENFGKLREKTLAWNKTWYDTTLPTWFMDRTFMNTSILATTTCLRLDEGRYYFWEGVGCCPGTCTHVWGYAQAIGRVFPEIERALRREIDYGLAFRPETGAIDYRAEYGRDVAVDGQAGCILRAYREHLMSRDDSFLTELWPKVKASMELLIRQDGGREGLLSGAQYNTLDTAWFGEIAWISSLYLAAVRACEAMAAEMGDDAFAQECRQIAEKGSARLVKELFNGEYFINRVDPGKPEANNTNDGCHIDQLYGQSWAMQVGLPRIAPAKESKSALKALFRHSFFEDVWEYRRRNKEIPGGRWYAAPGEPGLVMCSFPRGGAGEAAGKSGDAWAVGYFNECMSGFEYQAASHMIAEGLVEEGLTVVRAIHERYGADMRNPYNEVECSDHYGRAMASYGAYIALTGFWCHGPKGQARFQPKVKGKEHRFPFILPEGWGTWSVDEAGREKWEFAYRAK